ncbi:hypothetical protein J2S74_004883 [Evansella vedderi]|uniref:Uncharacterized protein n=1 Tax=Evansella vedderi TaxID=38282 RepID=A0ABU0A4Z9_9BACI|nr:hypothetical protein [Evansella vedderi]MDQ0257425.1 hypothetical protein [Evansella vedderi]
MNVRSRPITDKYFRYVISWLLFGVAGGLLFWQWGWYFALICILTAFVLTFGVDYLFRFIVKQKVRAMVKEEPVLITDAVRLRLERRGFLVITEKFVLFVPVFRKIKTVIEADQIVRYEVEGLIVEITAKFPNQYRTFSFQVLSPNKVLANLQVMSGESMPYKHEKLENNSL